MVASVVAQFAAVAASDGPGLVDGGLFKQFLSLSRSARNGIVAAAGGTQALATPLTAAFNSVDTVATASDSVQLPQAVPGSVCIVYNNTATTLAIFGKASNPNSANNAGDTIASSASLTQQATGTGITLATALTAIFICFTAGQWKEILTA